MMNFSLADDIFCPQCHTVLTFFATCVCLYMQRQDEDLDLTCALELQHRTCDARNVVIRGGDTVKLMNVAGQENVTCISSDATFNDGNLIAPCTSYTRNWAFRDDGIAIGIFLHNVRGSNKMLVTSDFSPILSSSTHAGTKPRDAPLRIEMLPGAFTGMVHYDRFVETYFKSLPSCSSQLTWSGAIPLNLGLVFTSRTFFFQSQVCIKQAGPACLCIRRLHAFWSVLRYTRPQLVKQRHHPLEQTVLLCSLEGCRANTFS